MYNFENYNIYLRGLENKDYKTSVNWRQDTIIWDMVVGPRYYVSETYEKIWVDQHINDQTKNLVLGVCEKTNNQLIGYVYLNNIDYHNRNAIFAKLIGDRAFWGKGYGTQATMLMLYHAFYELGLKRVYAVQLLNNHASIRVNQKCGFVNEGILRKAVFKSGNYQDLNIMGVLKEDYDQILEQHEGMN